VNCTKFVAVWLLAGLAFGCSASGSDSGKNAGNGKSSSGGNGSHTGATSSTGGPDLNFGGTPPIDPGGGDDNNPTTCDQAAKSQTYIGCDFWPTVTYNPVYHEFGFAVVVANGGAVEADVKVERKGAMVTTAKVPPGGLATVMLPWVMELKGEEFTRTDATTGARKKESELVPGGAYHMTSSVPVTAWQFSPLDYQQPAANCPGLPAGTVTCLSVSNDASLLLPSTAMTGNYRLAGRSARLEGGGIDYTSSQGGFAITATKNDTKVDIQLSADRKTEPGAGAKIGPAVLAAGAGVTAAMPGQTVSYTLQAGDVLQLVGQWAAFEPEPHGDLSGSLLNASAPVQVIAFNPLLSGVPAATDGNPDHIEETVLPAEVIGKSYVVAAPTGPDKRVPGHMVRFFGNFDGTTLTYPAGMPAGAPTTLKAGEVVEIGPLTEPFVVDGGEKSFSVVSIMLGGTKQDPDMGLKRGDPSITTQVTPEQFRKQYTFLAPTTYLQNYADIVIPTGATVTLDGQPLTGTPEPIGTSKWSLVREPLSAGQNGAHRLEANEKVGLQVLGFGSATSYSYPGGLDLKPISDAPTIVK
jgi:hypothetical protein